LVIFAKITCITEIHKFALFKTVINYNSVPIIGRSSKHIQAIDIQCEINTAYIQQYKTRPTNRTRDYTYISIQ